MPAVATAISSERLWRGARRAAAGSVVVFRAEDLAQNESWVRRAAPGMRPRRRT